jgi:hypothetical protein
VSMCSEFILGFLKLCHFQRLAIGITGYCSGDSISCSGSLTIQGAPSFISPTLFVLTTRQDISLSSLDTLVIDEADLIFSFGHDEDMKKLMEGGHLPKVFQSFLMSATMTKDVQSLKGLILRDPV